MKDQLRNLETKKSIWGVSPETVFLFIADIRRETNDLVDAIKLEIVRTNAQKDEGGYRNTLLWLSTYLGLMANEELTALGKMVLVDRNPLAIIQACLFSRDYRIRNFLTDIINKDIKLVRFSELETYFPGEALTYSKLLASFGFLNLKGKAVEVNIPLVQEIGSVLKISSGIETWLCARSFFQALVGSEDKRLVNKLASELLTGLQIPFQEDPSELTLIEAVKRTETAVPELFDAMTRDSKAITTVLERLDQEYATLNKTIVSHIENSITSENEIVKIDEKKLQQIVHESRVKPEKLREMIDQLVFIQSHISRIYLPYIETTFSAERSMLITLLGEVFGDNIRVDSHFVVFLRKFLSNKNVRGSLDEYWRFVLNEYSVNEERIRKLRITTDYLLAKKEFVDKIQENVYMVKNSFLHGSLSKHFCPFYFVYTLLSAENLGREIADRYVGNNDGLKREIQRLSSEWPLVRTDGSFGYVDMTDKLFSKGLEGELQTREIRIMTPYTDYELKKYVSMLRRLIERGYTLYILCRLSPSPGQWNILKKGLLEGLGEKAKSVRIRTYTRFREFLPVSKLTKLDEAQRKEFGAHAKLFIIGDADDGAVLLGSANLLENSYNWNPECGIYTENSEFVESAKVFFDFVWNLSENDALDFSRLDRIPKGPFFPHYYHR